MTRGNDRSVARGSWRWALQVAERTAFVTIGALFIVLNVADVPAPSYRYGLALIGGLALTTAGLFRVVLPRFRRSRIGAWIGLLVGLASGAVTYGVLVGHVPQAHLFFVPVIVIAGLLGDLLVAWLGAAASVGIYLVIAETVGNGTSDVAALLNSTIFVFTGFVAGLLSQELRAHYRKEQAEHRIAVSVGHRLTAVVGAIEEAVIFSDRQGRCRLINRRAAELLDLDLGEYMEGPVVQLLRVIARETEDPEGFMEAFQELRDDPEKELRFEIEQIIPERRSLRVLSRPVTSGAGLLVGRIDVYTDATEGVRRAEEVERLYREARQTAESYQRGLLPKSTPSLPRLSLVAHYIPAAGDKAVCGDFYDFLSLKEGKVGVVLGDVTGMGPGAVNDAALTRYTLGSVARSRLDAGEILEVTNEVVTEQLGHDRIVRVLLAILDPERAVLEYANAGHVPPLLYRSRSRSVDWLEEGGLPLGIDSSMSFKSASIDLDPGDMLFLYTDGVTEAPRAGRPLGQGKLADLVREYGVGTPGELLQAIRRSVEAWVDDDLRDDMAMVGCQVAPDTAVDEPTRELVLPNDPARIREVRAFIAEFLADLRTRVEISADVLLASSEAVSNATKYGRQAEGRSEVRVRCRLEGRDVVVTVADEGPGFEVTEDQGALPDPLASGGRGLFLMREMSDELDIDSTPQGTTVTIRRQAFDEPPLPP